MLVRFAGPRLAGATDDDLVPVKLRRGGRILGGSLSWDQPQPLAAFSPDGPFAGLTVPDDVLVNRQVLAEPDATLAERTWATLADGTPLVTAEREGKGLIVLFHVSADTRWSNLPLSGVFVEMLKRIVDLAGSNVGDRRRRQGQDQRARPAGAAEPYSRRIRRVRRAARQCPPDHRRFLRPRHRRTSARLLWTAGRHDRSEHAGAGRPARIRSTMPASTPASSPIASASRRTCAGRCSLPRCSAVGRRPGGVLAGRRHSRAAAPVTPGGSERAARRRRSRRHARGNPHATRRTRSAPPTHFAMKATLQNPSRLRRHRQCGGRQHQQGRAAGVEHLPRPAHGPRAGRADRARHRARRTGVLPADLLADGAGRGEAVAEGAGAHRHLHEARRLGAVRYPRCGRGARPVRAAPPTRRACWRCAISSPRSTFPSWSRCRATTC